MTKARFLFKKSVAALLTLCLMLLCTNVFTVQGSAAGQGYSDLLRVYSLSGVGRDPKVYAYAYLYGSDSNSAKNNYAMVYLYHGERSELLIDVVNGDEFEKMVQGCISTSQTSVDSLNEALLTYGAPDSYLLISERPAVVDEILDAVSAGKTSVRSKNNVAISPDALRLAAEKGGGNFRIHCDSMVGNSIGVRMTVTPSTTTKGIVCAAFVDDGAEIIPTYEKIYTNKFAAVQFLQEGSFGTTVEVAAKVDLSGLNTKNLVFYSFNRITNKYTQLENTNYSIDEKGFLHFYTSVGNTVLITDKKLQK